MSNKARLEKEYTDGAAKIKIFTSGAYINLTEKEAEERDYRIGATVRRLLEELTGEAEKI